MPKIGGPAFDSRRPIMCSRADVARFYEDFVTETRMKAREKRRMGNILSFAGYLLAIILIGYLVFG